MKMMEPLILTAVYNPDTKSLTVYNRRISGGAVQRQVQYGNIATPDDIGVAVKDYVTGWEKDKR